MRTVTNSVHLAHRFVGSLSFRPVAEQDERWARAMLLPGEQQLWLQLTRIDRRHAVEVARRFEVQRPDATRDETAAALLHDVGKLASRLGTLGRVAATVVGPRTRRYRLYHDHERIGAEMLEQAGSSTSTVELVLGRGSAAAALRRADEI